MNTTSANKRFRLVRKSPDAPTMKAVERERGMWDPHPDPAIRRIEEGFYRGGFNFLSQAIGEAFGVHAPRKLQKALRPRRPILSIPEADWGALAKSFEKSGNPIEFRNEWTHLIDRLVNRLFPRTTQEELANSMAIQAHWMGKVRAKSEEMIGKAPPANWTEAEGRMTAFEREAMQWTKTRALEGCKGLEIDARQGLMNALVTSKQAGEGPQALARRCFDGFADLNRDWRRTALTETAAASFNGMLATVDTSEEWEAEWITAVRACEWCQKWKGKRFSVVSPSDPRRNGMTDLWVGKTNLGRHGSSKARDGKVRPGSEMWWPCQPCHPNCSCSIVLRRKKSA